MIDNTFDSVITKQADIYKPTNDYIFQCLFGVNENKHLLIGLLNAILQKEGGGEVSGGYEIISDLEIVEKTKLLKKRMEDKQGILDIRAITSQGVKINVEIQLVNKYNILYRTLFYWAKLYSEQLKAGQNYNELKKTITINILDFDIIKLDAYHNTFHLREDTNTEYIMTDLIEIHFVELQKFARKSFDKEKPIECWLAFLGRPNEEVLKMAIEKEPTVADAEKAYENLLTSDELRMLSELQEKAVHDEVTNLAGAREEGMQNGLRQGAQEGMQKGINYKEEIIAKNMLMKNFTNQQIIDITSISPEKLVRLMHEITESHSN